MAFHHKDASSHDLEKGLDSSTPALTLVKAFPQRRRKVYILALLCVASLFFLYQSELRITAFTEKSSWGWVKDSMQATKPSQPHDAIALASPLLDQQYEPTAALKAFANEMHMTLPTAPASETAGPASVRAPSHDDQILLFLSAMKGKEYRVPEQPKDRQDQLQPSTTAAFLEVLSKVEKDSEEDGRLYTNSYPLWLQKHRAQSPLTVFSKSYCPYSRRAKALLKSIGATFDVYEVDLREDAGSLQAALRELSGHETFPTIFVREELIGGSDDLTRLQSIGVLNGILQGAHVKFT